MIHLKVPGRAGEERWGSWGLYKGGERRGLRPRACGGERRRLRTPAGATESSFRTFYKQVQDIKELLGGLILMQIHGDLILFYTHSTVWALLFNAGCQPDRRKGYGRS